MIFYWKYIQHRSFWWTHMKNIKTCQCTHFGTLLWSSFCHVGQPIRNPRDARGDSCHVLSVLTAHGSIHHDTTIQQDTQILLGIPPRKIGVKRSWSLSLGRLGWCRVFLFCLAPGGRGINSPRLAMSSQSTWSQTKKIEKGPKVSLFLVSCGSMQSFCVCVCVFWGPH